MLRDSGEGPIIGLGVILLILKRGKGSFVHSVLGAAWKERDLGKFHPEMGRVLKCS